MDVLTTEGLGYLTEDEPGIGGVIKAWCEDFIVEEQPLFEPEGRGDHLYLFVEKHKRLTTDVVRLFSRHFSVPWRDVGYAGLKDKHAVTRQWFSIEHAKEDRAAQFDDSHIRILAIDRHPTKLKRGNLAGNRFQIKVRDVNIADALRARRMLERLAASGAPNFIGEQRFGYRNQNQIQGRCLLLGDLQGFLDSLLGRPLESEPQINQEARRAYDQGDYKRALELWPTVHRFERQALGPLSRGASLEHAVNGIDKPHRQLLISAFQSAIFNQLLNDRLKRGLLDKAITGDLAFKHDTRGVFEVVDPAAEQPRYERFEISPTGPMWGKKMTRAGGEVGQWEAEALAQTGVSERQLADSPYGPDGSRRAMRMPIANPDVRSGADERGPYVFVGFDLPRGCFATTVMREIMKSG